MAPIDRCLASMARLSLAPALRPSVSSIPPFLAPALVQSRQASVVRLKKAKKKRTVPKNFPRPDLKKREWTQYSLCEAMRYECLPACLPACVHAMSSTRAF